MISRRTADASASIRNALALTGYAMIFVPIFAFDSAMTWPGHWAAIPVLGTAFVLWANRDMRLAAITPVQMVGNLSYSLYLWHWPMAVGIYFIGKQDETSAIVMGMLAAFALSALSYKFIETAFRESSFLKPVKHALPVLVLMTLIPGIAGYIVYYNDGVPSRVSAEVREIEMESKNRYKGGHSCKIDEKSKKLSDCDVSRSSFALWGDSHAEAVFGGIEQAAIAVTKNKGTLYTYSSCPTIFDVIVMAEGADKPCAAYNEQVLENIKALPPSAPIFIANRFSSYLKGQNEASYGKGLGYYGTPQAEVDKDPVTAFQKNLSQSLCRIKKETAHEVYVVAPIPEIAINVPKTLARRRMMHPGVKEDISIPYTDYQARQKEAYEALNTAARTCGIKIIDTASVLCDGAICRGSENGRSLYVDDDHISESGNKLLQPLYENVFRTLKQD